MQSYQSNSLSVATSQQPKSIAMPTTLSGNSSNDETVCAHSSSGDAYHWDCSDWVRRSHNPLPNITEVPGSEVPDSSSFHSNESNESQCKQPFLPQRKFQIQLIYVYFYIYCIHFFASQIL